MQQVAEYVTARPSARLRPFFSGYTGYRVIGRPGRHQGVPSAHLTFIVSLDGTIDLATMPDPAQPPASFTALVGGLHDGPAVIAHDGRQYGMHLELTWRGARALLGMPAGELAGTVVELPALLGRHADRLVNRLAEAPDWAGRFAVLDIALDEMVDDDAAEPPPEVAWAWRRLVATGGGLPVGLLSAELGWSRRYFGERFRREVGLAPKAAARVIRFERVCQLLRAAPHRVLADVAADAGYFDQAHLAREFRDLAGVTATEWLTEHAAPTQLPSVQADAELRAAG